MEYIKEGLLQAGRVAFAAAIPLVIAGLQTGKVDIKYVGLAVFTAFLSGLDKYVHEHPEIDSTGIIPF